MSERFSRPAGLPDFRAPPLNEVVLSIQFEAPPSYQQIKAGEVWGLYADRFPTVQEQPPLPPSFETFGPQMPKMGFQAPGLGFGYVSLMPPPRFWFVSKNGDNLIQFQKDKLVHNWRKFINGSNYPRFESIISNFEEETTILDEYMKNTYDCNLKINQCEISYVNHIYEKEKKEITSGEWLSFLDFHDAEPDDFTITFRRVLKAEDGRPLARLICDCVTTIDHAGQIFISLTLTVRGMPAAPNIDGAIGFLRFGREKIVNAFAELSTKHAQQIWERIA